MTLVSAIIQQAFRESNIIAVGQDPTANAGQEAFDRLQALVAAAYGFEVGELLSDWPVGREGVNLEEGFAWDFQRWCYPPINVRLIAASDTPQTVYLPVRPYDGSRIALIDPMSRLAAAPITLDANGRAIGGAQTYAANTDGLMMIWFYRADLGGWVALTPLDTAGAFPFPPEFDDYFITKLAMRLNPRYGRSMAQESVADLDEMLSKLRSRYRQSVNVGVGIGLTRISSQYGSWDSRRNVGLGISPQSLGDRGWYN